MPYFGEAVRLGLEDAGMAPLKAKGLDAERAMFAATNGVNTHKGMVYSMGLLLYGMGLTLEKGGDAIGYASDLARSDAHTRLNDAARIAGTNGGAVYAATGAAGAIGEAADGFPHAVFCTERLSFYGAIRAQNAGALALCDVMANLQDTNVLHRGGAEGLAFVQAEAKRIGVLPVSEREPALFAFDDALIERNLSPGGSADMLALGYLLNAWQTLSADLFSEEDAQ